MELFVHPDDGPTPMLHRRTQRRRLAAIPHGKMMVVDRQKLYVLGYNLTRNDMEKTRSLGVATRKRELVQEALKLFEADFNRKSYVPSLGAFLVSPLNSRERLAAFIGRARKQLLIYGLVSDNVMIRLLEDRQAAGVDVRIIGKLEKGHPALSAAKYPGKRLHLNALVRDARVAFLGSQSLRKAELDRRREVGVVFKDRSAVKRVVEIFEADWALTTIGAKQAKREAKRARSAGRNPRKDREDVPV